MSLSRLFLLSFFPYFSIFANISLRIVFGILGNITAFGFYASAAITINKIRIKRTVEDSQPYSYLATLMNCMICFVYGLPVVHPNNTPLLIINGVGFLLEVVYIAIFCQYSPYDLCDKIFKILALELVIVICVLASVLGGPYTPGVEKIIDHVLGILFIICGILMYGSHVIIITKSVEHMPLTTTLIGLLNAIFWTTYSYLSFDLYILKKVFQTENVECLPFYTSFISFLNAVCWMTYSILRFNLYILIPNAMGVIFGAAQLLVHLYFKWSYRTTPRDLELPDDIIILGNKQIPKAPDSCLVRLRSWLIRTL